jgi:hypothetical protein
MPAFHAEASFSLRARACLQDGERVGGRHQTPELAHVRFRASEAAVANVAVTGGGASVSPIAAAAAAIPAWHGTLPTLPGGLGLFQEVPAA